MPTVARRERSVVAVFRWKYAGTVRESGSIGQEILDQDGKIRWWVSSIAKARFPERLERWF
jgi:hypothetical protein